MLKSVDDLPQDQLIIHAFVSPGTGVQLWFENPDGHRICTAWDQVRAPLPPAVDALRMGHAFRAVGERVLLTPKGRLKCLDVPVIQLGPQETLDFFLRMHQDVRGVEGTDNKENHGWGVQTQYGPELQYLLGLYRFADELVHAGAVVPAVENIDSQWYPRWKPSIAGPHQATIRDYALQVPGILSSNFVFSRVRRRPGETSVPRQVAEAACGGDRHIDGYEPRVGKNPARECVEEILTQAVSVIVTRKLASRRNCGDDGYPEGICTEGITEESGFHRGILTSFREGTEIPGADYRLGSGLRAWYDSVRAESRKLVLHVEDPVDFHNDGAPDDLDTTLGHDTEDGTSDVDGEHSSDHDRSTISWVGRTDMGRELYWRVQLCVSESDLPATPLRSTDLTSGNPSTILAESLSAELKIMRRAWSRFESLLEPVDRWLHSDRWLPSKEYRVGDMIADQVIGFGLPLDDLGEFVSQVIPALRTTGIKVQVPRSWTRLRPEVSVMSRPVGRGPGSGKLGMDQLLTFDWNVTLDGQDVSPADRERLLTAAEELVRINGRFVFLENSALQAARRWVKELGAAAAAQHSAKQQGAKPPTIPDTATLREVLEANSAVQDAFTRGAEDSDHAFRMTGGGWIGTLFGESMGSWCSEESEFDGSDDAHAADSVNNGLSRIGPQLPISVPDTVRVTLRDHQRRGLSWLAWMFQHRLGAILADDMGLGKTLQVLALLAWERSAEGREVLRSTKLTKPTLVIAPTTVVGAWRDEAARFVPSLRVDVDHGATGGLRGVSDQEFAQQCGELDLVVTTYGRVRSNPERFLNVEWERVVADEAQNMKNPGSKTSRAVRSIPAEHYIALTGTPVENRLSDLYAIMDFANPGILGSAAAFQNRLAIPAERHHDPDALGRVRAIVRPFVLRREKTDAALALDLPPKREYIVRVPLTPEQASLYQAYVDRTNKEIAAAAEGNARRVSILGKLTGFKKICNHPAHYLGDGSGLLWDGQHRSAKVEKLFELVRAARAEGKKVLVFTQFPSFGEVLVDGLQKLTNEPVEMLHGGMSMPLRQDLVRRFQSDTGSQLPGIDQNSPSIIVASLKASGTGITLTKASVVVHFDRWWNPAVEDQATDRAYRIGQNRDVEVYKMTTIGTLEERIHEVITGKRELAAGIIGAGEGWIAQLSDEEVQELWKLRTSSSETLEDAITLEREQGMTDD